MYIIMSYTEFQIDILQKYEEELNKSHNETIIEWFLEKIDELKEKLKNTN